MRNTHAALHWIVEILNENNIPFEMDGGFAAELYGTERELADIDINIYEKDFHNIVPLIKEYITYGPQYYEDDHWKMLLVSMEYAGQHIDIGALETMKYYDPETNTWINFPIDLTDCRMMDFEGMMLPVINEIKLMIYKKQLGRGVDRRDVYGMEDKLLGIESSN